MGEKLLDKLLFQEAIEKVVNVERESNGIGTLSEKTLHAVLKHYYEPYVNNHETKIGSFVADIVGENGIIEIQTAGFDRMRKKLTAFLEVTSVTVVYPIAEIKWLSWIDEDTGETTKRRKSNKKGTVFTAFYELYKIRDMLTNPNLTICITMLDINEYRRLNGWSKDKKKGSVRADRVPNDIIDEIYLRCPQDYLNLLPTNIPDSFTVKELAKLTKTTPRITQFGVMVLKTIGVVRQTGKIGNAYVYERCHFK